jgi:GH35 family endo-1,4-beta-xylanase
MSVKRLYMYLFLIAAFVWSPCYGDWKSDANARIESIRKRNAEITVIDSNGDPISGVDVLIEQIGHRFAFGTCINSGWLGNTSYTDFILDHFEWAVCENDTKWKSNESTRDSETYELADNIYTWCNSNGIKMRGHCLVWETGSQTPSWVSGLQCATYPTASEMLEEVDERINSAVNHYKNKFHNWDVDNEMLSGNMFDCLGEAGRAHFFQQGNSIDPNCGMFMNEYNGNSWVPWAYDSGPYVTRANSLIGLGAPINGLGIQGHLGTTSSFDPARYYSDTLQPLAALNRPIWVTEFDVNQPSDTTRANIMEDFYRICFSHPSVEGILMWGFWQGITWQKDWWIVNSDWTLNAAGIRYEDLMDEWTTTDSDTTDGSGKVSFRGFHGTYKITLSKTGQPTEIYTIELEPGETTAQFVLKRYISNVVGILGSWATGTTHAKEPGTNRALVFIAHAERNTTSAPNLTSVTYGGQAMTKVVDKAVTSGATRTYVAAFILDDAGITAATNSSFSRTWSGSPSYTAYASVFLSNVNQSALTGATAGDEIATSNIITTPWLATSAGDMVIDAATSSNTGTYTTNNGFTKAIDFSDPNYTGVDGYKTANGASEIPSATHSTYYSRQSAIGFVVQAAELYGDLTHDNKVDVNDLSEFCKVWLVPDCDNNTILELDLNGDCVIDFYEYSLFAQNWLRKLE